MTVLPWQMTQWQKLIDAKQKQRLPHALMLVGYSHAEALSFAEKFSSIMLCQKDPKPCGECHSCQLMNAKSHPDFLTIAPEKMDGPIKIDQIRELVSAAHETAMLGGYRVIVILKSHAMNQNAANALLKTLEEPAPQTLLILISEQNQRLPATILSRCQKIYFQKPDREKALEWLAPQWDVMNPTLLLDLAEGSPLDALQLAKSEFMTIRQEVYQALAALSENTVDPVQVSTTFQTYELSIIYHLLMSALRDMLRYQLMQGKTSFINTDFS
ncbi:MAG TPA: DNA polymerase III subunit delta', partial [Gammaproteobacteria bacterium]|nr:DNA polymerase III subunit delta' [Gammaproteobacteria bacterium]